MRGLFDGATIIFSHPAFLFRLPGAPVDFYLVGLYAHFIALVAAVVASTIVHVNVVRLRGATTVSQARDAGGILARVSPLMPLFALALFVTGALLVQARWSWSHGWVIAGIAGLVTMPLVGALVMKPRLGAIGRSLGAATDGSLNPAVADAIGNPVITAAMAFNHTMSMAVMLVMVLKPALGASLAILLAAPIAAAWSSSTSRSRAAAAARLDAHPT